MKQFKEWVGTGSIANAVRGASQVGISKDILVTGLQILGNFPCDNGELALYYIHRLMLDNLLIYYRRLTTSGGKVSSRNCSKEG